MRKIEPEGGEKQTGCKVGEVLQKEASKEWFLFVGV